MAKDFARVVAEKSDMKRELMSVQPLVIAAQAYLATVVAYRRTAPNSDAHVQADLALAAAQAELLEVARRGRYATAEAAKEAK